MGPYIVRVGGAVAGDGSPAASAVLSPIRYRQSSGQAGHCPATGTAGSPRRPNTSRFYNSQLDSRRPAPHNIPRLLIHFIQWALVEDIAMLNIRSCLVTCCLVALSLAGLTVAGCGAPVKPPTSYGKWTPKDSIFHVDHPEGWKTDGGGKPGTTQWVRFSKGGVMIHGATDISTSLFGDIASSANNLSSEEGLTQEQIEERAPVNAAHVMNIKKVDRDEYGGYKEEGKPIKFMAPISEGRKSIFTARVGAGKKVKGYRATLLARNNGITFYCYCSEKDFEKFRPAFDKILESVSHGGA